MLFFVATAVSMMSCNKDNAENGTENASIVGDWEGVNASKHYTYYDTIGGNFISERTVTASESENLAEDWIGIKWKFATDGTFYVNGREKGTYVVSGNLLYLSKWDDEYTILELTSSKLKIMEYNDGFTTLEKGGGDGERVFYTRETTAEFKRI